MKETAMEVVPHEEIEHRYPDEWVLVEVVKPHNDYGRKRVRLIGHSPDRADLEEPYWRARSAAPEALLGEFYTAELVQMPEGTSIEVTSSATAKVEHWLRQQPEAKIVMAYIGQGAARFFFSYNPELPDPSFAKLIVLTPDEHARERLKLRLRQRVADGLVPGARVRVTQLLPS